MAIDREGQLKRIDVDGIIYYDSILGIAGTTYPIGTRELPSNTIADVIAICTALNLRVIDVRGTVALGAAMAHYDFIGHRHEDITDTIDLNGQDLDGSIISKCVITGDQGATGLLTLSDCLVYLMTNFQGIANYCDLYGSAMSLRDASFADLHHCNSVHSDLTITVQAPARASFKEMSGNCTFTAQDGGVLYIRGFKGTLVIDAMTAGVCDIYANGADITINGNCTGGTISVWGHAIITGAGGGVTINNYTLNSVPGIDAVTNIQERDAVGNKGDTAVQALSATSSAMRYIKGIVDMLVTAVGIIAWPARSLPAANVAIAKVLRYIAEVKPEWAARTSATHTTTGASEETILTTAYTVPGLFYFNLTLRNMVAGDDFTIRVYKRVDGTNYDLKSEQQFVGLQTLKVYEVEGLYTDGTEFIRVTIQRNGATNRAFPYSYNCIKQPVA